MHAAVPPRGGGRRGRPAHRAGARPRRGERHRLLQLLRRDLPRRHLAERFFDLVLLDLSLPDSFGFEGFVKIHGDAPRVPVVLAVSPSLRDYASRTLAALKTQRCATGRSGERTHQ